MNLHAPFVVFSAIASLSAAEVPKIFSGLLEQDVPKKGFIGMVTPPAEIDKYVAKVETAARKDPKWFREFSGQAKAGAPLPYDERLGLTKTEYDEYLALWDKRDFKPMEEVMLLLRKNAGDTWTITSTGAASTLSTIRYDAKSDSFRSPNGELKRIADITADASSVLGEWTGMEWKFEEETGLGKIKENLALGRMAGDSFGLIVYRAQEMSSEGTRLLDKSLVIRFALAKPAAVKESSPAAKTASKTPTKPAAKAPAKNTPKN
jgi:hypothetical protein